jgi:hypothetical protein
MGKNGKKMVSSPHFATKYGLDTIFSTKYGLDTIFFAAHWWGEIGQK